MSRKSEKCYIHVFETLKEILPLNGNSVMTDFELGMRNAIHRVYPTLKMFTCWFHFCQEVKRKASQLINLVHHIKTNVKIRSAYYKLLSLPVLPAKEIIACFQMIKSQVADEKVFKPFLKYYENQWIKKEGPEAISVFKLTNRTTGSLEAQNGVLGKRLRKHGHFFKFFSYLLSHEYAKSGEFDLLIKSGGSTVSVKKHSYKQRSDKIVEASIELEKGKIRAAMFLNRMAYLANRICTNLDEFTSVDDPRAENDNCDFLEDEEETSPYASNSCGDFLRLLPCCECLDKLSQVTMYPCGHLKVCSECWKILVDAYNNNVAKFMQRDLEEEYRPKLKCPFCNNIVENYLNKT